MIYKHIYYGLKLFFILQKDIITMNTVAILHHIVLNVLSISLSKAKNFQEPVFPEKFNNEGDGGHVFNGNFNPLILDFLVPKIHWELNWLNQWDQKLIKFIKDELLIPPPTYSEKNLSLMNKYYPKHAWKHQGQNGEALVVEYIYEKNITRMADELDLLEKDPKFFIESGAMDGELISNTIYLELKYNWTGLLVEPNPAYLNQIINKKRNVWIFPYCLSPTKTPVVVDFDAMAEYGGIINYVDGVRKVPGNINANYTPAYLGPSWRKTIKVQCFPLYSVLKALGLPTVHYFSLDIEGAEYPVLQTIPYKEVDIKMFSVEVEHAGKIFEGTERDIQNLLKTNGYHYVAKSRLDKFFMKVDKPPNKVIQVL